MKKPPTTRFLLFLLVSLFGAASLSGVDFAPDHRKIDPILLPTDDPAILAAQRKRLEVPGSPDLPVPVFIHLNRDDPEFPGRLPNLGGSGRRVAGRLVTGRIPRDAARYLSNWPQVAYIEGAKRVRPMLDLSSPAVSADLVQAGSGLPSSYTGAGTYVGIVDTGLDNTHLDFHTGGSGSSLRVYHTYADPSELLPYGLSPNPLVDEDGHGTHVTGVAVGNGYLSGGIYTGMAPGAGILFGKTSFMDTDIVNAATDLVTYADNVSKPISVNLSLGGMIGPHDGTSGFEKGINDLSAGSAGSRHVVSVAAGNEIGLGEHFRATLGSFGTAAIPVTFLFSTVDATVDIWADGDDRFTVTAYTGTDCVTVPYGSSGSSPQGKINVSNRGASALNGATNVSVFFSSLAPPKSATIRLERTRNGGSGKVDAYIDSYEGYFGSSTDTATIIEPANGKDVLAVGSFQTKTVAGGAASQAISSFSSLGPTRDGRLKPDVAAPGEYIYAARSFHPNAYYYDGLVLGNGNYAIQAGTSISTPHVAGIAALVWESNPALSGAQLRERIRRTAGAPTDGSATPNTTWGFGKVNAWNAVANSVASITAPSTAQPGAAVSMTSENSSGAFGDTNLSYAWSLSKKPAGSNASLASAASTASFVPDLPGDYTVSLTVSDPSAASPGTATSVVHVNHAPVASITGPASDNAGKTVSFSGRNSADADGQSLTYRWVLVSRPSGSSASLSTANADNVSFASDAEGTYEIGLRVDEGLDNSALAVHSFTAASSSSSGGSDGGGGGCSIAGRTDEADGYTPVATAFALLSPAVFLAVRRRVRHFIC